MMAGFVVVVVRRWRGIRVGLVLQLLVLDWAAMVQVGS
jgi:hypothetical protein